MIVFGPKSKVNNIPSSDSLWINLLVLINFAQKYPDANL
jgi:hypothetical protein